MSFGVDQFHAVAPTVWALGPVFALNAVLVVLVWLLPWACLLAAATRRAKGGPEEPVERRALAAIGLIAVIALATRISVGVTLWGSGVVWALQDPILAASLVAVPALLVGWNRPRLRRACLAAIPLAGTAILVGLSMTVFWDPLQAIRAAGVPTITPALHVLGATVAVGVAVAIAVVPRSSVEVPA